MTRDEQLKSDCTAGIRKECADICAATHRISTMLAHMEAEDESFERAKDIIRAAYALRRSIGDKDA